MKKILKIAGILCIVLGLGCLTQKEILMGLGYSAVGAAMVFLPGRKAKTQPAAVEVNPEMIGGISQITGDRERVSCEDWVVLDVETNGLSPTKDRIIEIAAVKYHEGQPVDTLATLVNPGRKISQEITDLTGITNRDLQTAPKFQEIAPRLVEFLGDLPMVAHNARFDAQFVWNECARANVCIYIRYIDTIRMARWCLPPQQDYKLETLIREFDLLDHEQEHRALSDVEACENLYMLCRSKKSGKS